MLIAAALIAMFAGLLVLAAANDIATMTIPNWISIAIAAAFPIAAYYAGLPLSTIGWNMGFATVILAAGIGLFSVGVLGGGDVKVIAAAAAWFGPFAFWPFFVWMAIAGGVLAIVLLLARAYFQPNERLPSFLNRLLDRKKGAPYAVAIAAAGLCVLHLNPIAQAVLAGGLSLTVL
jgi:prepilin peptidase CpaA